MKLWRWLTTPDPNPGFTRAKLLKLLVRVMLFSVVATLLSSLLQLTPVGQYLNTWWGSLIFVLILYVPMARFLTIDTFTPRRLQTPAGRSTGTTSAASAQRRKERNRYAGVRKSAPKYGGRR
ncbi:hypothetical protein ACMT4L_18575 [Deinococcus sp. A31D244]|uniref:Uncharacterized protein n=1 Tax=Deinococcus aquaticus TaxID=328692 RepID=A0ABY7V3I3_9DEIO|nr:hypothetical protein [Deinococcus aquaticus]WDA59759.1 hypothetical protein M8445_06030 [Deinococcus aquaticus]